MQLTELTEEINQTSQALAEAESLEIQLNMAAAQKMTGAQVEEYAASLGMEKVSGSQVTYINVAQEDQGTVVQQVEEPSCWAGCGTRSAPGSPNRVHAASAAGLPAALFAFRQVLRYPKSQGIWGMPGEYR